MTLSIGLSVNPQDPRWLELALEAERAGVDSIWVPEFWAYDAFAPLAAIAARTQRVRLATGIAQLGARTPVGAPNPGDRRDHPHDHRGRTPQLCRRGVPASAARR